MRKLDGTLGNSQKGEVQYLNKSKFAYKAVNIEDFARMMKSKGTIDLSNACEPDLKGLSELPDELGDDQTSPSHKKA